MSIPLERVVRPAAVEPIGPDSKPPLLVLLHGLGSNEMDLMGLAPELPPEFTVVSYRAPYPYSMGGFAWFDIQWLPEGKWVDQDQALKSRDLLIQELEALPEIVGSDPGRTFLGGFSQGAMMTLGVIAHRPELVYGAVLLSGRSLPRFWASSTSGLTKVSILAQHGKYDQVIGIDEGREMESTILANGGSVDFREYPMAHEVSYASVKDLSMWLRIHLSQSSIR